MSIDNGKVPGLGGGSAIKDLLKSGRLAWRLLSDPRVPFTTKLIPIGALAYLVFPVDFVADIVPFLGQADDLVVLAVALRVFISMAPEPIVAEFSGKPTSDEAIDAEYRVDEI